MLLLSLIVVHSSFCLYLHCIYIYIYIAISLAAGGAAAGISSRLGMSSIVKQAETSDKSFDDVVGVDEAKGDLQEIVLYLKDPKRFTRLGGKLPKGVSC